MAEKSKILIIGGTGYIGKFMVEASTKLGHPTFVLVRERKISDPEKSKLIESFKGSVVTILYGDIYDHESLLRAIKQVDIVISTLGTQQLADQVRITEAIKEAGNVKSLAWMQTVSTQWSQLRAYSGSRLKFEEQLRLKGYHIRISHPMPLQGISCQI